MKKYLITLSFCDDSRIYFNCETPEEVEKTIKDIFINYNNDIIKIIQILNREY